MPAIIDYINGSGFIKTSDAEFSVIGDTATYMLSIVNTGDNDAINVVVYDTIPVGVSYIPGSLMVDGIPVPGVNIMTGVPIGTIKPWSGPSIEYKVIMETSNEIVAKEAVIVFNNGKGASNEDVIYSIDELVGVTEVLKIQKESCKCMACIGEKIPFTVKVTNMSTGILNNIVIEDIIPAGVYNSSTSVSNGSWVQNNNILTWNIPNLAPGETEVAMMVIVATDKVCFDNRGYIVNTSKVISYNNITNIDNISDTVITNIDCFSCDYKKKC